MLCTQSYTAEEKLCLKAPNKKKKKKNEMGNLFCRKPNLQCSQWFKPLSRRLVTISLYDLHYNAKQLVSVQDKLCLMPECRMWLPHIYYTKTYKSLLMSPCHFILCEIGNMLGARSQIPVYGLTGWALGGRLAVLGAGFCRQNLGIKCIPCVGTHLWKTMAAKSTLSYCQIYLRE